MKEIKAFLLPSAWDRQWSFVYRQLLRFPPSNPGLPLLPPHRPRELGICQDGALTGAQRAEPNPKIGVPSYFPSLHLSLEVSGPASPAPAAPGFHKPTLLGKQRQHHCALVASKREESATRLPQTGGLSLKLLPVHTLRALPEQNQFLLTKENRSKWKFHCRN